MNETETETARQVASYLSLLGAPDWGARVAPSGRSTEEAHDRQSQDHLQDFSIAEMGAFGQSLEGRPEQHADLKPLLAAVLLSIGERAAGVGDDEARQPPALPTPHLKTGCGSKILLTQSPDGAFPSTSPISLRSFQSHM